MASKTELKITEVRAALLQRYPNYWGFSNGERLLQAIAYLTNDVKVREKGKNAGEWVEAILGATGLGKGYPWCAAAVEFASDVAKVQKGPKKDEAAVWSWHRWAKAEGLTRIKPARGRLAVMLNNNGTGHIGVVAAIREDGKIVTYEGNTSSGESGSQRDGDGCYKRVRSESFWAHYIEIDDPAD